jgi:lipid A ethanolaminephosphotransferase
VVVLFSLWLASICNLALWKAILRMPDAGEGRFLWTGIGLALMMTCAFVMLLSLLNWRWTLKLSVTLLLVLAAINAYFMLTQRVHIDAALISQFLSKPGVQLKALLNWQLVMIFTLLGVLPTVLLWRMPLRRTTLMQNAAQNLAAFVAACAILGGLWLYGHQAVRGLIDDQPQLRQLFNPFNLVQNRLAPPDSARP